MSISTAAQFICSLIFKEFYCFKRFELLNLGLMFEHDRSAARGEMAARKLVVFKHNDALGNVPAHALFERVKVDRINGEKDTPASSFSDYKISIDKTGLNEKGVTVDEKF